MKTQLHQGRFTHLPHRLIDVAASPEGITQTPIALPAHRIPWLWTYYSTRHRTQYYLPIDEANVKFYTPLINLETSKVMRSPARIII
jgi:hypothetical protein